MSMANPTNDPIAQRIAEALVGRGPAGEIYVNRVTFVKRVILGTLNPMSLTPEEKRKQEALLNRCLHQPPGGRIIGSEVLAATFLVPAPSGTDAEPHQVRTRQDILHIGFERKPFWLDSENG